MRQSAGAHIAACALLEQAINEASEKDSDSWSVFRIKAILVYLGGEFLFKDPMRGSIDDMLEDLIWMIHGEDSETIKANATPRKRLVPEFMLKLACSVSPF
ncbi:hypothetical protein RND71_010588 [Anisodus tanguticus]|uniref:Uncharacterized protein n=1 Tax=Anisodus tanguticus TaxID=243964 RepID=A0AAE1SHD8_9SOLA|nr:hypothetical protein RND71_010588 [Anisodus tanguticus]